MLLFYLSGGRVSEPPRNPPAEPVRFRSRSRFCPTLSPRPRCVATHFLAQQPHARLLRGLFAEEREKIMSRDRKAQLIDCRRDESVCLCKLAAEGKSADGMMMTATREQFYFIVFLVNNAFSLPV